MLTASGGLFFGAHKGMHISEHVCKTCHKDLGILLKCRETFEKFLAACNSSKNTGLSQLFFQRFLTTAFQEHQFPNKNQKVNIMLTFMNSKLRWLAKTSKTTFPKKVNPMEYPVHTHTHTHTHTHIYIGKQNVTQKRFHSHYIQDCHRGIDV